MNKNTV